jgi:hypothetical protein
MQAHSSNNEMQEWRPESSESRNTVLNRFWGSGCFRSDLRKGSAFLAIVVRKMKNQGEKRPLPFRKGEKPFRKSELQSRQGFAPAASRE